MIRVDHAHCLPDRDMWSDVSLQGDASMNPVKPRLAIFVMMLAVGAARGAAAQYAPIDLGMLGGTVSYASAVNESGQVVGDSLTAGGRTPRVLMDGGRGDDRSRHARREPEPRPLR